MIKRQNWYVIVVKDFFLIYLDFRQKVVYILFKIQVMVQLKDELAAFGF